MHAELLGCGQTGEGQLGARLSEPMIRVPERIIGAPNDADGTAVKSVACGEQHTVFLTKDGKMWSVGSNLDGQLGRGKRSEGSFSIYPVSLTSGVEIVQIDAGRAHSIAVADDGRVFAWGSNEHGQLGMESSVVWQETPKRIKELNEVVQVASGSDHCIALTDESVEFGVTVELTAISPPGTGLITTGAPGLSLAGATAALLFGWIACIPGGTTVRGGGFGATGSSSQMVGVFGLWAPVAGGLGSVGVAGLN